MEEEQEQDTLIARPYQVQLEEIAIKKNTIIHLPTGSGKTFIAVRLIARFRDALQKPWGAGGQRTFFLVNNVPLVNQQKKVIEQLCPVKSVGAYSSENRVDYWNKEKWDEELTKYQVVVMTSQILFDMLTHGYVRVEDINLMIFDECHHAVDDHPMRSIMKHFELTPVENHPRILGLTATLLNGNVTLPKLEDTLKLLETTFHATIATVNELGEVLNYSTNPHEQIVYYKLSPPDATANEVIKILDDLHKKIMLVKLPSPMGTTLLKLKTWQNDITTDPKKIIKSVKNMVISMMELICEFGIFGGALGILAYTILLERLKRKSLTEQERMLYTFTITHATKARKILLHAMENDHGYDKIIKHSSSKVLSLLDTLKEFNPKNTASGAGSSVNRANKPMSAIIFTQKRFTAKILYNLLKHVKDENPTEFDFLKHDFIVGFNLNPYKSTREQYYLKKSSETALLKFSNGELNCLISTSVIEEGVDIPQCLLVLRYDPPVEYRSYIQSKGRARSGDSSYVLLISEDEREWFTKLYHKFQMIEHSLQNLLSRASDVRDAPTTMEIQRNLYEDDDIPAFVTPFGNRLSSVSAISLLNRYCARLPRDQFTTIIPMWIEEKQIVKLHGNDVTMSLVTIMLPIASPVKQPIVGLPNVNLKIAKRSAALNACIRLYEEGELDPRTLLPRHYGAVDFDSNEVKKCFPNWPWDEVEPENSELPKAGTKKRIRKHAKEFPKYLNGPESWTSGDQLFKLHIIKLKAEFNMPEESREQALYHLLQRNEGYGILTFQSLPIICDFPMFLSVGEVTTSLHMNYAVINLNQQVFSLVKRFHYFIFDQVLDVAKKFVSHDGSVNAMYVVPVKGDFDAGYDIDWELMQTHTEIRPVTVPTDEERKSIFVKTEDYLYSIVSPWYKGSIEADRYIVSKVLEHMTPRSGFATDKFSTYEEYYLTKYNLQIEGYEYQPLLEVININTRMNCLLPRAATINEFTEKQRKQISSVLGDTKRKGFDEVLIPEFCIKYDFPGVLWYKAMILPSVLHRIHMLLVAYELRAEIAKATKYGKANLSRGESWQPMEVNIKVATQALRAQAEDPLPINSIDRINNPIDDTAPRPRHIVSMKESAYQLQKQKLSQEYPWDEKIEPIDIERHLATVTVMDIECYDEFVMEPLHEKEVKTLSPPHPSSSAAILPPPQKYNDKIAILSKKATGRGPELKDILSALITIESHDMYNLERAETLGDSFLKYAASLYLFHKFPKLTEGQLTNIKSRLIGNRNLFYAGKRVRIGGRLKNEQFAPRKDFLLPAFFAPKKIHDFIKEKQIRPSFLIGLSLSESEALSGTISQDTWKSVMNRYKNCDGAAEHEPEGQIQSALQSYVGFQAVADKSIADCVEALIGTYLLSGGIEAAIKTLEWFKIIPPEDNLQQLLKSHVSTPLSDKKVTQNEVDYILNNYRADVEAIIGYQFKDSCHLLEALSHPSYIRNRITRPYERLEFIGDAILDFLITAHIFENCGELKPGDLTDLRSALVNNVTFASYVVKLGLHKFLCSQLNPTLDKAIMAFADHQAQRNYEIVEDVLYLIDEEDCQVAEYVDVPKVLSDIFEAICGAIYLDSGGDLRAVWRVVYRIMWREIDSFSANIPQQPVRVLYENIHACASFGTPQIVDCDVQKMMIPVKFTKNGRQHTVHGFGSNTQQAKRAAAKLALRILGI